MGACQYIRLQRVLYYMHVLHVDVWYIGIFLFQEYLVVMILLMFGHSSEDARVRRLYLLGITSVVCLVSLFN